MLKKISWLVLCCMVLGTLSFTACMPDVGELPDGSDLMLESDSDTDGASDTVLVTDPEVTDPVTDGGDDETDPPVKKKSIDIYIIAGQSNGSGYTKYDASVLSGLWSRYNKGSSNVIYTGRAEYTNNVNTSNVSTGVNEVKYWTPVVAGQGRSTSHMGAEVGMAKILNEKYYKYDVATGENRTAGIIKFAHGGTSLLNSTSGENAASGNWVSPSYAEYKNISHSGLTGGLYRNLLTQVKSSVTKLKALGYNDINIKGVFWMQGEGDRYNPAEYKIAFKYFASDLRRDLGNIMGEDLSDLAIMIGEISETSGSASTDSVATNQAFIAMQRGLAQEMDNVYVVASGKYKINWLENGVNKNGQDAWHWTTADMFNIGVEVGECILDNILKVS